MPSTSLHLDPATATLWCGLPSSGSASTDELIGAAINSAHWGDTAGLTAMLHQLRDVGLPAATEQRLEDRVLGTVSSMWHECRHFFDLVLSNYGNFKTRRYVSIYANLTTLLGELPGDSGFIHCPIEHYGDRVQRAVYSLPEPPEASKSLLRDLLERSDMIRDDRATIPTKLGPVSMGGTAQLEVMAYICQLVGMSEVFGVEETVSALAAMPLSSSVDSDYLWVMGLTEIGIVDAFAAGQFGDRKVNALNSETVLPLFLGCLATRHWGQPRPASGSGRGTGYPAERLFALASRLGPRWKQRRPSAVEAWQEVNDISSELWGRTVLEEIETDLDFHQRFVDDIGRLHGETAAVYRWATDLLALRRHMFGLLCAEPQLFVDATAFPGLLARVHVPAVNVSREGTTTLQPSHRVIVGYPASGSRPPHHFATAADLSADTSRAGIRDFDAWATVVSEYGPITKLLLNGRRQQVVLGPELERASWVVNASDIDLRYAPTHELPLERLDRSFFWYFRESDEVPCDLCRAPVARGSGGELSPWLFRLYPPLADLAARSFDPNPQTSYENYIRDWSGWFACPSCLDQLRALPVPFQTYLQEV